MLLSYLFRGDFKTFLISMLLSLPVIFFALSVHESAHGLVAYWMGDPTARNLGRITLNPVRHLDPVGFLAMLFIGIGWAKPVPINSRNFRNPKWGFALSSLAGPLSNFLLGIINAMLCGCITALNMQILSPDNSLKSFGVINIVNIISDHLSKYSALVPFRVILLYWLAQFFLIGAIINFIYSVFNLIPIPPYDGSRILLAFLPTKTYFAVMRYERQIMIATLIVLLVVVYFFSPFTKAAYILTNLFATPIYRLVS